MTLRRRLALGAALAVILASGGLALAAYLTVAHSVRADLDRGLRDEGQRTANIFEPLHRDTFGGGFRNPPPDQGGTDGGGGSASGGNANSLGSVAGGARQFGRGAFISQMTDRNGALIARTDGARDLGGLPKPLVKVGSGKALFRTVSIGGARYRVFESDAFDRVVQAARSLQQTDDFLTRLRWVLLLAVLFAALSTAILARFAARAALRPAQSMTRTARNITHTCDLAERVEPSFSDPEIQELSDALNEMLASLDASQRTQRQFVADASHELKTPLTSLRGNAIFLARKDHDDPEANDAAAAVARDIDRVVGIADGLTVLARLDATPPLQFEPTNLDELARDALARARENHAGHSFELSGSAGTHVVDPELARRIVSNLVENAGKHTPAGTTVLVALETLEDGRARLVVEDDGPGLPEAELARAFDRFHRPAGTEAPGSGLGLAIVAEAARQLGGEATISAADDRGLRVEVVFGRATH